MSIEGLKRAGDWVKANQGDIALVIGFILVALISFGAGRLSGPQMVKNPVVIQEPEDSAFGTVFGDISGGIQAGKGVTGTPTPKPPSQGLFVASKGGSKYHWPWCSYAQKIKDSNKAWFNSETEAQGAGFAPCGCIQNKAPAGYAK